MGNVFMNIYKGQRMDITAQMKDADAILDVFRKHSIRFDKKYTTINDKGPSTITFKGLHADKAHADLTEMVVSMYNLAKENQIGNVYVKLTSFNKPPVPVDKPAEEALAGDTDGDETPPVFNATPLTTDTVTDAFNHIADIAQENEAEDPTL